MSQNLVPGTGKLVAPQRTVVVTGAAGGIGRAIVKRFAADGDRLVVSDVDTVSLEGICRELNGSDQRVWSMAGDLRSKTFCENLIEYAVNTTRRIDVLVNNAGIITRGSILETTDEDWHNTIALNLTSIFFTCRKAIAHMKEQGGGVIVNIASTWGLYPGPNHPAYCTSKGGVAILTKCLGRDHAGDNIRINAVCPNEVNTPMLRKGFIKRGFNPETAIAELNRSVPLGRIAEPDDIADVVVFLASDAARYIAGTVVEVNGAKPVY